MKPWLKKIFHDAFNRKWSQNLKKHPILTVELEVTKRCPMKCLHCGSSCTMDKGLENELTVDEITGLFQVLKQKYGSKKITAAITGGEAFVRKDLFQIIARITEMGFDAGIITSGYLFRPEHIELLFASGIRSVSISIDGLEKNHNWLRGRPDAYSKAVNAIRMLVQSGLFTVEAVTTVNTRNFHDLIGLEKTLGDLGVHGWRLGKTFPVGRADGTQELFISGTQIRQLLDFIKARRKDPSRKIRTILFFEEGYYGNDYELEVRNFFTQCMAGVNVISVLADGSITGCAAASPLFIQGNIRKDSVIDVWENKFIAFRDRSWMKKGVCGTCGVWNYCRGDGFHLWEPDSLHPAVCNHKKL